ncbi:MAG: hypothetical protein AB7I42_29010 [Bradyrhizobium sp.]|uniref:hypothetical protein n=1 Tax=Bradyrhizobium sp. TaxID=376 RepID=UPI003D1506A9
MSVYAYANMIANFLFEAGKFLAAIGLILSPILVGIVVIGGIYAVFMGLWKACDKLDEWHPNRNTERAAKVQRGARILAYILMVPLGAAAGGAAVMGILGH